MKKICIKSKIVLTMELIIIMLFIEFVLPVFCKIEASNKDLINTSIKKFESELHIELEINKKTNKEIIKGINKREHKKSQIIDEPSNSELKYSDEWINDFNSKIEQLKAEFPSGMYWNHKGSDTQTGMGVTNVPCNHRLLYGEEYCNQYQGISTIECGFSIGTQCAGFASLLSDRIFGTDAPVTRFTNYDDIRIGDQARINNDSHTVFIIDKTDDYVIVAECNADYKTCVINWGRKIPRSQLTGFYMTRWN